MGIYRRTIDILDINRHFDRVTIILTKEFTVDIRIDNFRRGYLHVWIRRQGLMIVRFIYHFSILLLYVNDVVEIALILCIKF